MLAAFKADDGRLLWYEPYPTHSFAKFVPPTIANGKVFLATFGDVQQKNCPFGKGKPAAYEGSVSCGSIAIYGYSLDDIRPPDAWGTSTHQYQPPPK